MTEDEQKKIEETPQAKLILNKYFSKFNYKEEEDEGLSGKIKFIISNFTDSLEERDPALKYSDF